MLREFTKSWNEKITERAQRRMDASINFGTKMFAMKNAYKASDTFIGKLTYRLACIVHHVGLIPFKIRLNLLCAERSAVKGIMQLAA